MHAGIIRNVESLIIQIFASFFNPAPHYHLFPSFSDHLWWISFSENNCFLDREKRKKFWSCDFLLFSVGRAISSDSSFWLIAMNWWHQSASRLPAEQTINWRHHLKFSHHRFGFLPQRVVSDKISEENDCNGLMLPISLPAGRTIRLFSRLRLFRRGFAGIWIISTQWFCGKSWRDMT